VNRFWEIDFFRGLGIILMVIFHTAYDLTAFGQVGFNFQVLGWKIFAYATGSIFLLLVGVSLTISLARAKNNQPTKFLHFKSLIRGLKILLWAMAITIVTRIFLGDGFVVFGVLHLIGLATVLAYPLRNFKILNVSLGLLIIALGVYLQTLRSASAALVWLGIAPINFYSVDYYPLLPWLGVVLLGVALGNWLYPQGQKKIKTSDSAPNFLTKKIACLGQHSLLIYLIHQPILIVLLWSAGLIKI